MTDIQQLSASASASRARGLAHHPSQPSRRATPAPPRRAASFGLAAAGGVAVFRVTGAALLVATDSLAYAVLDRADELTRTGGRFGAAVELPATLARMVYRSSSHSLHDLLTAA